MSTDRIRKEKCAHGISLSMQCNTCRDVQSCDGVGDDGWHADFQARCRALGSAPPSRDDAEGAGPIGPITGIRYPEHVAKGAGEFKTFDPRDAGFTLQDCGCRENECEGRTDGTCHHPDLEAAPPTRNDAEGAIVGEPKRTPGLYAKQRMLDTIDQTAPPKPARERLPTNDVRSALVNAALASPKPTPDAITSAKRKITGDGSAFIVGDRRFDHYDEALEAALSAPVPDAMGTLRNVVDAYDRFERERLQLDEGVEQSINEARAFLSAPVPPADEARSFCLWLQDYFRKTAAYNKDELTATEANTIRSTLNEMFENSERPSPAVAAEPESDAEIEERLLKQDARDMLRLIDHIADKIGLPYNEELSRDNFNAWLSSPAVRGDRGAIAAQFAIKFPATLSQYSHFKIVDWFLSLPVQPAIDKTKFHAALSGHLANDMIDIVYQAAMESGVFVQSGAGESK